MMQSIALSANLSEKDYHHEEFNFSDCIGVNLCTCIRG